MDKKYNYHTSYKGLFRVRPVMYKFGNYTLPIPIKFEAIIIFLFMFALILPICILIEPIMKAIFGFGRYISAGVFAGILTYMFNNVDPAGKFLPVYVFDFLRYLPRQKKSHICGNLPRLKKSRVDFNIYELTDKPVNRKGLNIKIKG